MNVKWIYLGNNTFTCVDAEDFYLVKNKIFSLAKDGYAVVNQDNKIIKLQHFILGKKKKFVVDHFNRHKLDNRRINLRRATKSQNRANSIVSRGCHYNDSSWVMQLTYTLNNKRVTITKSYPTKQIAIKAYRKLHSEIFKEFSPYTDQLIPKIIEPTAKEIKRAKKIRRKLLNEQKKKLSLIKRKNGYKTIHLAIEGRKKKVVNDLGEVFESINRASKKYNGSDVGACIRGAQKTAGGRTWKFYKEATK